MISDTKTFGLIAEYSGMVEMGLLGLPNCLDLVRTVSFTIWRLRRHTRNRSNSKGISKKLFWIQTWLPGCGCCSDHWTCCNICVFICILYKGVQLPKAINLFGFLYLRLMIASCILKVWAIFLMECENFIRISLESSLAQEGILSSDLLDFAQRSVTENILNLYETFPNLFSLMMFALF